MKGKIYTGEWLYAQAISAIFNDLEIYSIERWWKYGK